MSRYYYLATSLPPIDFPNLPDTSFVALKEPLRFNLSERDYQKVAALQLFIDISNIRPLLLEEEIDSRGNLSEKELDEALLIKDFMPDYVFDFLSKYDSLSDKLRHFSQLIASFFQHELTQQTGFLQSYFSFERDWRLVILALRAKTSGRDVVKELQFEDYSDPLVSSILAQKDSEQFDPPMEYRDLKEKFLACGPDPWQQHKMLAEYRFQKIEEIMTESQFSIDYILAYLAKLMIVEYWNELDEQRGMVILDTFKSS